MQTLDWVIVLIYFVASALVGLYYAKRAGTSMQEFFLSGRNLPWWLAGTSMVATTFAADTPLAVTELVAKNGIAGNWLWWNFVFGGMLTVFFFARLWRRAGIMTDVEFAEIRYSGKPAAFLRGFRAVYLGVFMNCVILGWVNLAMAAILEGMFEIPHGQVMIYVALAMVITAIYSAMSGLWGVTITDAFQFALAMFGCIVLAFIVLDLPQVGGMSGLVEKLPQWTLRFTPSIGENATAGNVGGALALSVSAFLAFIGVQWWASWYPGAEPGGGGYIAQRMMSAKDEKHSLFATLWFTIAHYCIRPWPWIIVGLASLVLYPQLGMDEKRLGYVFAMRDYLPVGLKGLLVASFFAAFMSTVSTQLNWGTSYIMNDFYRRFLKPNADEKHYVGISRWVTGFMMIVSLAVTMNMDTISGAWTFIIEASAGLGLVLILRWFWWRINAWSEISATVVPLLVYGTMKVFEWMQLKPLHEQYGEKIPADVLRQFSEIHPLLGFPGNFFMIVAITTVSWIMVTFLTKPADMEILKSFFTKIHPGGWWKPVSKHLPAVKKDSGYGRLLIDWLAGIVLVYDVLFGLGKLILGQYQTAAMFFIIAAAAASVLYYHLSRVGWEKVVK